VTPKSKTMTQIHECGGAILTGENEGQYDYCDQCSAYSYEGPVPSGTDKVANRKAWDDAAPRSPDGAPDEEPQCESGQWSGTQCSDTATTTIEWMPEWWRGTHAAAGSRGRWPVNGSIRSRVCRACADEMREAMGDWAQEVDA